MSVMLVYVVRAGFFLLSACFPLGPDARPLIDSAWRRRGVAHRLG